MWGLINIFHFRRAGSAQKLIASRNHGLRNVIGAEFSGGKLKMLTNSENGQGTDDRLGITGKTSSKPSLKKLVEEEMLDNIEEENSQSEPESRAGKNTRKRTFRNRSKSDDINAIMDELYTQLQQKNAQQSDLHIQPSSREDKFDFPEKICQASMVFINQKFISTENLNEGDDKIQPSKEFLDALEILFSNKQLLLELLEDPNSVLVKHIQTLQESMAEKDRKSKLNGVFPNDKRYSFFWRTKKSPSKENENSDDRNRIVILKPVPTEKVVGSIIARFFSHFSFTGIKRRFQAMGKERSIVENPSVGSEEKGVSEKNVGWMSPSRNFLHTEKFPKLSTSLQNRDQMEKTAKNGSDKFSGNKVSNIDVEAKKHISEMLKNRNEDEHLSSRKVPKSLGRILSLPEYDGSPIFSPRKESDHEASIAQMRLFSKSGPLMQNLAISCSPHEKFGDEVETPSLNPDNKGKRINDKEVEESGSDAREKMNLEGETDIIRTIEIQGEQTALDFEQSRFSMTRDDQTCGTSEDYDAQAYPECSISEDSCQESQSLSTTIVSPSSPPIFAKVDPVEIEGNRRGRPSPISVLEPLFADDDISPTTTTVSHHVHEVANLIKIAFTDELPIMPRRLRFEKDGSSPINQDSHIETRANDLELIFEYCVTVLKASGIMWDDLCMKLVSSDQLLDEVLLGEVNFSSDHLFHDEKLLFDCINEVLVEICEFYFGCLPFVSFVNPDIRPIPNTGNTIREVCAGLEWHLTPHLSTRTLEQIVKRDLEKDGKWMNLRFDCEHVGQEMSEVVFNDLIEDTILSYLQEDDKADRRTGDAGTIAWRLASNFWRKYMSLMLAY